MTLIKALIKRLLQMIVVLFIISLLTFTLMKLSPGNPVDKILHLDVAQVSSEQIKATEDKLGLNDSIFSQWWHWFNQILHLDLGTSYETNEPVTDAIVNYAPPTLLISLLTLVLSLIISIPLGVIAAKTYHGKIDKIIRILTSLSVSLPSFFIGIMLIYIFNRLLHIDNGLFTQYILPIFTLSLGMCAYMIRLIRSNLLDLYQSPVVEASRLRGMTERYILLHDLLKPTLLPIIPLLAISLGSLIGGTVVIENLFDIPGLGYLLMDSIKSRDYPVIQGCVLFIGFFVVLINTLGDIVTIIVDPKQRLLQRQVSKTKSSLMESGDQSAL
ncbi:ABC transporter permease [Staphylococcus simiae]|uniref:nickel ABC transporter permease n=1 Tax=Staphylococcus simiae TaxID=308354 RepID=UPI001A97835C|nr:nickel ABC transporter permease [Staphylococcus simiae]MBO1197789.1 ABC transporter permease [Staphylococcus simiae]MBO1200549.1 ABC transporter permease [Staphylococcus simiae]MBO1202821.1 ABC transporter permease [Staphylococcus simiae]MBO1211413.1 ABC transporter permease [Staphylococcus simiae]MBO1229780.1 ABC transporter permease [Staphylococcus simiae]